MKKRLTSRKYWSHSWGEFKLPKKLNMKNRNSKEFTRILKRFLPKKKGVSIIEIGCAPGSWLHYFKTEFGYNPYGVEYTENGYVMTKKNFEMLNLNPKNIMKADFFDKKFQNKNKEKYDIVYSAGFIEHFKDPKKAIELHLNILKKGGYLVISIPNKLGVYYPIQFILNKKNLDKHNLKIMKLENFKKNFKGIGLKRVFADYVEFINFGILNANKWLLRPLYLLQIIIFDHIPLKGRYFSTKLLFIGKKNK